MIALAWIVTLVGAFVAGVLLHDKIVGKVKGEVDKL
jgi:hypothetical protein